jgi:exonuclease V gamma subunit
MAFRVHLSPDIAALAQALSTQLGADLRAGHLDIFTPAAIVVPHTLLGRWLTLQLSQQLGIAANLDFPYLEQALWKLLRAGDLHPDRDIVRLDAPTLQRLLLSLLLQPRLRAFEELSPVWTYIDGSAPEGTDAQRRAWQLCDKVARLFLEYECQRQTMIAAWQADRLDEAPALEATTQRWQQRLYHELFRPGGWRDQTLPQRLTLPQYAALVEPRTLGTTAPPLYLFGIGHASPFHLDLLCTLGTTRALSLYLPAPLPRQAPAHELRDLWGVPTRQMVEMLTKRLGPLEGPRSVGAPDESPAEIRLAGEDHTTGAWQAAGSPIARQEPRAPGLLATLQASLRTGTPMPSYPQDRSLQVWACPGEHREVEAVYHQIVAQLAADPTLRLTDIAVLVPEMDTYLPLLHGVFSQHGLPYSVSDANASRASLYAGAVTALLGLIGGAFTRRGVFDLLRNPCYLAAAGADADLAEQWLHWTTQLGIFHSFTSEDKCRACQGEATECAVCRTPDGQWDATRLSDAHTWGAGLRRLRLGRIMDAPCDLPEGEATRTFANYIPYADLETADDEVLAHFSVGVEVLYRRLAGVTGNQPQQSCAAWREAMHALLSSTLAVPEDSPGEASVRDALFRALDAFADLAPCFPDGVAVNVVREYMLGALAELPARFGRPLTDGLTLSTLRQARFLPFRQIYVLGLGEGSYPGAPTPNTLDLRGITETSANREEGDLTLPEINRQIFADILLGARDRLVLTYCSRNVEKDAETNPSSLITQLERFLQAQAFDGLRFLEAQMPLTGRSLHYLQPAAGELPVDPPVNYDALDRQLALAEVQHSTSPIAPNAHQAIAPLLLCGVRDFGLLDRTTPAMAKRHAVTRIALDHLVSFLIHPAEARLKHQLGLYDADTDEAAEQEDEPFRSAFSVAHLLTARAPEQFVRRFAQLAPEVQQNPARFFAPVYDDSQRRSQTPDGVFALLDRQAQQADFTHMLAHLKEQLSEWPPSQAVRIGGATRASDGARLFPALCLPGVPDVEIIGELSVAWELPDALHTVVFTRAELPKADRPFKQLLKPFLAYAVLSASPPGEATSSAAWLAERPLCIHVCTPESYRAISYAVDPATAADYLSELVNAYWQAADFDDLPLKVIMSSTMPWPLTNEPADEYAAKLQQAIEEMLADPWHTDHARMELLSLMSTLAVPADAFTKVVARLSPLSAWRVEEGE